MPPAEAQRRTRAEVVQLPSISLSLVLDAGQMCL
jgi:hypothetical protein